MLLLEWYDYSLRPCVFTAHIILEKLPPFWLWRLSLVDLFPEGSLRKIFHSDFFFYLNNFKNVCGFTTQGGFSEEGNSFSVCKISENYGRGVYVFRLGTYVVRFLEALCSLSAVCLVPRNWLQMEAGFLCISEQKLFQLFFLSS